MTTESGEVLGYVVLIFEYGKWTDTWDGEVHTTEEAGRSSLADARKAGWTAALTEARRLPDLSPTTS